MYNGLEVPAKSRIPGPLARTVHRGRDLVRSVALPLSGRAGRPSVALDELVRCQ